jgi:hypothetical protein
MKIDSETQIDPSRLEKLATSLGTDFLKIVGVRDRRFGQIGRTIILNGASQQTLEMLKQYMGRYFREKGENINVQTTGTNGYAINVGLLIL